MPVHRERYIPEANIGNSTAGLKVMEREERERQRMHKLKELLESNTLTNEDLGVGRPVHIPQVAPPALSRSEIYGKNLSELDLRDLNESMQNDPFNGVPAYDDPQPIQRPQPQVVEKPQPVQRSANWQVTEKKAKLSSGTVIPVWQVTNPKNGMVMETPFRIEEVALKIVKVLNETGNMNDTRVVNTISAYNRRLKIVKDLRTLKESNDASSKKQLQALKEELANIDFKLGI